MDNHAVNHTLKNLQKCTKDIQKRLRFTNFHQLSMTGRGLCYFRLSSGDTKISEEQKRVEFYYYDTVLSMNS